MKRGDHEPSTGDVQLLDLGRCGSHAVEAVSVHGGAHVQVHVDVNVDVSSVARRWVETTR